jgi:hypothetical protein
MKDNKKVLIEENVFELDFDKEVFRCDGCSRELRSDEGTVASGGMVYCDECAKDLIHCASCNALITEDDPHGIDYENYYCEDCAEDFERCEYCDSVIDDEEYLVEYDGSSYCSFCFEDALGGFICANCGADCTEDDGEEGEDGERYCYDCLEEMYK